MTDATKATEEIIQHLKFQLASLRTRRNGTYRLGLPEVVDLAKAHREIADGETQYGLKILEDVLEALDPRWREL